MIRYLRVRLGDQGKSKGGEDCMTVNRNDNLILDHLSLSWGVDGNSDYRANSNMTLRWLIYSEALNKSIHEKGAHAMCTSLRDCAGNFFEKMAEILTKDNFAAVLYTNTGNYASTTRRKWETNREFPAGELGFPTQTAQAAYEACLRYSGCSLVRDSVDERFLRAVRERKGRRRNAGRLGTQPWPRSAESRGPEWRPGQ